MIHNCPKSPCTAHYRENWWVSVTWGVVNEIKIVKKFRKRFHSFSVQHEYSSDVCRYINMCSCHFLSHHLLVTSSNFEWFLITPERLAISSFLFIRHIWPVSPEMLGCTNIWLVKINWLHLTHGVHLISTALSSYSSLFLCLFHMMQYEYWLTGAALYLLWFLFLITFIFILTLKEAHCVIISWSLLSCLCCVCKWLE